MIGCARIMAWWWGALAEAQSAGQPEAFVTRTDLSQFVEVVVMRLSITAVILAVVVLGITLSSIFLLSRRQERELKDKEEELESARKEIAYQQEILQKNLQLEDQLKELTRVKDYNENLLTSMNSGVVVINFECFVITFNKAAEQIMGIPKNEVRQTSIFDHPEFSGLYELLIDTLKTERSYIRHEIWVRSRDSRDVPLGVSTSILRDRNDESTGIIAIFRDLTEIKELESKVERAKRLASLGEMAAGVAHEIRNPLNPIRGFAQMISEDLDTEDPKRKFTQIIIEQVDHLSKIVNDLLDFAKYVELEIKQCDIWEVITKTIDFLSNGGELSENIEVTMKGERQPPLLPADPERLRQVFLNLFRNAADAMADGGKLDVYVSLKSETLVITIEDTGTGIAEDDLSKLFNPFFTKKSKGTGLGLSITYGIIERHGGAITVANRPEGGAVFTIILPRQEGQKVVNGL